MKMQWPWDFMPLRYIIVRELYTLHEDVLLMFLLSMHLPCITLSKGLTRHSLNGEDATGQWHGDGPQGYS